MAAALRFLGCKIQLISKSEIRYEGTLYTIDTEQSSVALANVRSFGTENRRPQNPVPPANEIYDYIIFRVSDIQDLSICETPAPSQHGFPHPMMNYPYQSQNPYGYQAYPNQYPYYPVGRGGGYQPSSQPMHHPMGPSASSVPPQPQSFPPAQMSAPQQSSVPSSVAPSIVLPGNQNQPSPQQVSQQPQVSQSRPNQGKAPQEKINEKPSQDIAKKPQPAVEKSLNEKEMHTFVTSKVKA